MSDAVCPSCGEQVSVKGTAKIGMTVTCKSCDTELEVVWLDPLELDWPMEEDDADEDMDEVED
jgi:alpha-aminoadipate carrier protein LysW